MTEGDTIELDRILAIADGEKVTIGNPVVDGAKVMATSQGEGKGKKVIVFKYKPKVRYRKKTGHRQFYTRLAVDKIIEPEVMPAKPTKKTRQHKEEAVATSGT